MQLPYATDCLADWTAIKNANGNGWFAKGTSLGEEFVIGRAMSKAKAQAYADKMNRAALEAQQGNAEFVAARNAQAAAIRAERAEKRSRQLTMAI